MSISWPQALAWRMRRQLLDPVGTGSAADVVRRLGAVPAQHDAAAELAVRAGATVPAGRRRPRPGRRPAHQTFAFRGAVHLMTPRTAAPT